MYINVYDYLNNVRGRRGRDHMVVFEFDPRSWRSVLDTTFWDKVCQVTCERSMVFSGYSGLLHQ
jgi:hypothetical protein